MLFNSVQFLIFFPAVCILYYVIPYRVRNLFLLLSSYYFYMCWNPKYALLMFVSTLITYVSGLLISGTESRTLKNWYVALSFTSNLAILFFFKYFNFFGLNLNRLFSYFGVRVVVPSFDVILPVGISFYTFQALSYTMDVYRNEVKEEKNFINYALFVSFFPQLVAGPIERSKNLLSQVNERHPFCFDNMRGGLLQMTFGYFQKVVISDTAAILVTQVYDHYSDYSGSVIMLATVLFAFQIYCDFGGYSNIARGAAKVMGFSLMENFRNPYFASSVSDFWRRWHISLSTWFRDYLYIPLGGNRKGKFRKYINIMIVFLTSGLWHGADWTYVIWGGLNGLFQVIGEIMAPVKKRFASLLGMKDRFSTKLYKGLATFALVDFTWLFFRADSAADALKMLKIQFTNFQYYRLFDGTAASLGLDGADWGMLFTALVILLVADIFKETGHDLIALIFRQGIVFRWFIYLSLVFFILIFGTYGPHYSASQFIYFQF